MPNWKKVIVSGSDATLNSLFVATAVTSSRFSGSFTGSLQGTSSWANNAITSSYTLNADTLNGTGSSVFATTGSNIFRGNQTVTGSLFTSGSNTLIGTTTLTGSLNISGSTTQTGTNTLLGNTTLSGSIIISGSQGPGNLTASVQIFGDIRQTGYHRFDPVNTNIDTSVSASYIYVSGSTNDLYFSQNSAGYSNVTRLRWLESNLYTGILNGGVITSTVGSTTWNISSGSGIIVTQNAFTGSAPYPTVQFITWGNLTNIPITNSGSARLTYVGIDSTGTPVQQVVPWGSTDINQFDSQINLGVVLHLSGSVSTGVFSAPQISYGQPQKADDFFRAFGPLKISGHTLQTSGSTLGITKTGGSAYKEGANYRFNPNHPSTTVENSITTSKIYRYYISGSTPIIDTGVGAAGYTVIDPAQRVNTATGALTGVATNKYSIQRVFWIPNSPTNAFIVYYGNAQYDSLVDAAANINTEPFTEAPNTATNGIFVAWILVAGGASSLTNASDANIIQGGIFRNVGGIGSSGTSPLSNTLAGLSDVSIASRTTGDLLYYNGSQWINVKSLTGNYTITGSLNVTQGVTGSLLGTSSWATNALTASFVPTSSLAGNFFVQGGNSFGTQAILGTNDAQSLAFETSGSVRMTISSSGNVGIGTTTPSASLHISGSTSGAEFSLLVQNTSAQTLISVQNDRTVSINSTNAVGGNTNIGTTNGTINFNQGFNNTLVGNALTFYAGGARSTIQGFNDSPGLAIGYAQTTVNPNPGTGLSIRGITALSGSAVLFVTGSSTTKLLALASETSSSILVVSGSGNIGIGTASPAAILHSVGSGIVNIVQSSNTVSYTQYYNTSTGTNSTNDGLTIGNNGTAAYIYQREADALIFGTSNTEAARITSTGDVGIGTTLPLYKLDVNGTGRFTDTLIISSSSSNGALVIQQNSVGFAAQFVNRPDITNAIGQIAFSDLKTGAGNRAFGIGIGRSGDPQWINGDFIFAYYSGSGTWQQSAKIFNTSGNWIIGTSSLDEGFKLDVNGTARVNGTTTITGSLTVITGSNIEFQVLNTGVRIGNIITDIHTVTGSLGVSGSTVITNTLAVGTSSLGAAENTLVLGPAPAGGAGEGGQILLAASGGLYTSASMWDNWQNQTRLLRGTNAGSDAVIANFNMHTRQVQFPQYNSISAFPGTSVAVLAVDSSGNILTIATGSGGSAFPFTGSAQISGSLSVNGPITASGAITSTANGAMYFRGGDDAEFWDINVTNTVGIYGQQDQGVASIKLGNNGGTISGRSGSIGIGTVNPTSASLTVNGNIWALSLTGSLLGTASFATSASFTSNAGSASYALNAGNSISASFATNTISASYALNAGNAITASFATNANSASYALNAGNAISASFTTNAGSASYALNAGNAQSSSFASTASSADNFLVRGTLTAQTIVVQTITSSVNFVTGSTRFGTIASNTHQFTGSVSISGSLTVQGSISGSNITGSLLGTASYANNALSSSYAVNSGNTISASFSTNAGSSSYALNAGNSISSSFATNAGSASYALNAGNSITASFATNANSSSYALNAGNAQTASFATNAANAFIQNGNSFGAQAVLGTNDAQNLAFETNGTVRMTITGSDGNVGIGTPSPTAKLDVNGNTVITGSLTVITGSNIEFQVLNTGVRIGNIITDAHTATGSLGVSGSVTATNFTGSLFGTASWAINALSASFFSGTITSASYASSSTNAQTASFALNGNSNFLHTQSIAATTWSVNHNFQTQFPVVTVYDSTNSVIIPQQISASSTSSLTILFSTPRTGYVAVSKGGYSATVGNTVTVTSASYAATASYAEEFKISQAQYFATSSAISGSSRIIVLSTSSFNAVFVDYVLLSGSNQRAGTVVGTWNSSNSVQFMDNSTLDIGTTSAVTMSVAISASNAVVQTQSPAGWTIKTTYRTI